MIKRRLELAARRAELGFSQETLGHAMNVSPGLIARWERGATTPRAVHRRPLADHLQLTLPQLERLLSGEQPLMAPDGHTVPGWLSHYASLEQGAARLQTFESTTVPGLLQTAGYAEAVMRSSWQTLSEEMIADRVEGRMARQAVLDREPEPLELICIIDETALRRVTGDAEVMIDQLRHFGEMAQRPTVQILISPFTATTLHTVPYGSFRLFTSAERDSPYMVCTEGLTGFNYLDGQSAIEAHVELFNHLTQIALPPEQSAELIQSTAERYQ